MGDRKFYRGFVSDFAFRKQINFKCRRNRDVLPDFRHRRKSIPAGIMISRLFCVDDGAVSSLQSTTGKLQRTLLTIGSVVYWHAKLVNLKSSRIEVGSQESRMVGLPETEKEKRNVRGVIPSGKWGVFENERVSERAHVNASARATKLESNFFSHRSPPRPRPPRKVKVIKEPSRCCDRRACALAHTRILDRCVLL